MNGWRVVGYGSALVFSVAVWLGIAAIVSAVWSASWASDAAFGHYSASAIRSVALFGTAVVATTCK